MFFSICDAQQFEWEIQLKFYWWKPVDNVVVRQCTGKKLRFTIMLKIKQRSGNRKTFISILIIHVLN